MKLAVTIDVEEEGLFSDNYTRGPSTVNNIRELKTLDPLFAELGIHPTLLVSYQAARSEMYRDSIVRLNEKWKGEIGAHLHPWNTPPFRSLPLKEPVPSEEMPVDLLSAKLQTLLRALEGDAGPIISFRMGRFNMGSKMFSTLRKNGIRVDSSIAPMRREYGGPDHLKAPSDPYFPDPDDPSVPGNSEIFEVPLTILPVFSGLGSLLGSAACKRLLPFSAISWFSKNLGSIPAQPFYVGLKRLKAAVWLHRSRGGTTVTTYFHSSELMPGGCPGHRTKIEVSRFLEKLRGLFSWLMEEMDVESVTLSELYDLYRGFPSRNER